MHNADVSKLEELLMNPEKYRQRLMLRKIELEQVDQSEVDEKCVVDKNAQDPKTIKSGGVTSTVERTVVKRESDLEYQMLYSIVHNTPKFISTLDKLEQVIMDYKYKRIDLTRTDWRDIAELMETVADDGSTIGRTKALDIRNRMLKRYAEYIGYTLS